MRIDRVDVFNVSYTPRSGPFQLSGGRTFTHFDGLILKVSTDAGVVGWGEHASAPTYMTSLHEGAIAAVRHLAGHLLGLDPTELSVVAKLMDDLLQGHGYAKTAVDLACWDILGKVSGLPLAVLFGGVFQREVPILHFLPIAEPAAMAARAEELHEAGFRTIQIKVGADDWRADVRRIEAVFNASVDFDNVIVDANGAWAPHEAKFVVDATRDLPYLLEQPCLRLEENLSVRRATRIPMILDESADRVESLEIANAMDAFDGAMLKLSRLGGLSPVRTARDHCVRWGKVVMIEDMAGGAIATAAAAHVAASTPSRNLLSGSATAQFMNESYGTSVQLPPGRGTMVLPDGPGLGVEVDEAALGNPLESFG